MDFLTDDPEVLKTYSTDASLFTMRPKFVALPKTVGDLQKLVAYAKEKGESLTPRAGGTDMTGGPLSTSIVVDLKHFDKIHLLESDSVTLEPGVFYRDLEKETTAKGVVLPCYPASKNIAAIGGMVANNCGGELSLKYGKMENFVLSSKYIFSDGNEYEVRPLSENELQQKIFQGGFEGNLYKKTYNLLQDNKQLIQNAKPQVSKNSAGYYLWNIWNEEIFDLNKLLTGAQGTLGVMTEATLGLVPIETHHDLIALFFKSWDDLPQVVNAILPFRPDNLECFDKETLKLAIHFMPEVAERAGENFFSFAKKFLPEAFLSMQMLGLPELVVLVEVTENNEKKLKEKVRSIERAIKPFRVWHRVISKDSEEEKFWVVRRESFNLLRKHVDGKRTVPLVDDFCVTPDKIPAFLPRAKKILEEYGIRVNIAGHAGDGNFHIIPLMDLELASERNKLLPLAEKFYDLVREFKGTISGEHNDGIVRTPFLNKMYNSDVLKLFQEVKNIFDPQNIFNPGKKVSGDLDDFTKYLTK